MIPSYWRSAAVLVLLVIVVRVTAESLRVSEDRDRDWRLQRQFTKGNARFAADHERYHLSADRERLGPSQRTDTTSRRRNTEAELYRRVEDIQRSANQKDRQIRDVHYRRVISRQDSRDERRDHFELDPAEDILVRTNRRMVEDRRPIVAKHLNRIERSTRRDVDIRSIDDGAYRWSNNLIRREISQLQSNDRSNNQLYERRDQTSARSNRFDSRRGNEERSYRTLKEEISKNRRDTETMERSEEDQHDRNTRFEEETNVRQRSLTARPVMSTRANQERNIRRVRDLKEHLNRLENRRSSESRYERVARRESSRNIRRVSETKERSDRLEDQRASDTSLEENIDRQHSLTARPLMSTKANTERNIRRARDLNEHVNRLENRRTSESRYERVARRESSRNIRRVTENKDRLDRLLDQRVRDKSFEEEIIYRQQSQRPRMSIRENNERNNRRVRDLKEHWNRQDNRRNSESRSERVSQRESGEDRRQDAITRNVRLIAYPTARSERLEDHITLQRNIVLTEEHNLVNDRRIRTVREERQNTEQNNRRFADHRSGREVQESAYRRSNQADEIVRPIRQDNLQNVERVTETIKRLEIHEDRRDSNIGSERITRQFNNQRSFEDDTKRRSDNFESRRNRRNVRSNIQSELNQDNPSHRVERVERKVFLKSNKINTRVGDSRAIVNIPRNSLVNNEIDSRNRMDRTERRMQTVSMSRLDEILNSRIDKTRNLDDNARIASKWSWQLCQAILIAAILAQFIKNRDGLDKRMSMKGIFARLTVTPCKYN